MAGSADAALKWFDENSDAAVERLCDWLRIPSVSTDPEFRGDVRKAAEWAKGHLETSGLEVELIEIVDSGS